MSDAGSSGAINRRKILIKKEAAAKGKSRLAVQSQMSTVVNEENNDFAEGVRKEVPQSNEMVN